MIYFNCNPPPPDNWELLAFECGFTGNNPVLLAEGNHPWGDESSFYKCSGTPFSKVIR
jgi:hypothetical protein